MTSQYATSPQAPLQLGRATSFLSRLTLGSKSAEERAEPEVVRGRKAVYDRIWKRSKDTRRVFPADEGGSDSVHFCCQQAGALDSPSDWHP